MAGEGLLSRSDTRATVASASAAAAAAVGSRVAPLYGAAAIGGLLIAASFLRFQLFAVAWLAFVPLLWALAQAPDRRTAMRIGWVAGLTTNIPAFYWLVYTITVFGNFPWPLAVFFYLCLSLFTATQFVLFAVGLHRTGAGPLALAAPALWVTLEFWFPNLFPWRMAHSQYHLPVLMQIGELTGPYGLSFVMVWFAAAVARFVRTPTGRAAAPVALSVASAAAIFVYGQSRLIQIDQLLAESPKADVALVQGNISIVDKGDYKLFDTNLEQYRSLSLPLQAESDLIIWPETVSQHWIPADSQQLNAPENPFPDTTTQVLFGGLAYRLTGPKSADEFNSSFLIGPHGKVYGRYDKRILMPFGEYLPFASYLPFIKSLSPNTAGFTPGEDVEVWNVGDKFRLGPLICYEDLIASMSRETTAAGAQVLLNILNDAWYGDSAAPVQHQALAIWRTVENRRYLLRGSNTGVTSIIDPAGRIVAEGGLFTTEVIRGTVHPLDVLTFYTRYGDVFAWACVALALMFLRRTRPIPLPPSRQGEVS